MENLTASEIAGFGVGTLLLCATLAAPRVDGFLSSAQRSSLGMCKRCGDVKLIACPKCRGSGSIKNGSLFGFDNPFDDPLSELEVKRTPCVNCRAKGHFPCPQCCSNASASSTPQL